MEKQIVVLAFYHIVDIENPKREVKQWLRFGKYLDMRSRIYLSEDGINGQMSIAEEDAEIFMDWVKADDRFKEIDFKIHYASEHVFPKLTIKYREQLVALGFKVDYSKKGEYLTPEEWKEKLDQRSKDTLVVDVRNDYEWDVGHFDGAERPDLKTFREFPDYAKQLKEKYDPEKTEVMMYCTGGIRCELFSPIMKDLGFKKIYQLKGGVIKYGLQEGHDHWKGQLFVFDDRLVVPIDEKNQEVIGKCKHCGAKTNTYLNCANMDCNDLFLCCEKCAPQHQGCCCDSCEQAPRRRQYDPANHAKPYRKLPFEEKEKLAPSGS